MRYKSLLILLVVAFLFTGCDGYQKILKSNDTELKYKTALEYYNKKDYYKAIQLLDNLRAVTRGTDKAEDVYYYYAYAHYKNNEYILASYYFRSFAKSYPKSDKREECLYMAAYCKFLQAPKYYLDQTTTKEAIDELQLFINMYPQSKRVMDATKHIKELKARLEKKDFHKADMYHRMENWEAAAYALNAFLEEYPVSKYREQALFKIMDSHYNYAENSVRDKKIERYNKVIEAYENLMAEYPESTFKNKADRIKKKSENELDELKQNEE